MAAAASDPNPPRTLVKWGVVAVAVAGFAGMSLVLGPSEEDEPTLPPELADEPDAFIEGGTITAFRDDGGLRYRLSADEISHFDAAGLSTLQAPVLELHDAKGAPWRVASSTGEVRKVAGAEEEQVELKGDVILTQDRGDGATTEIATEALTLYPRLQQAWTDQTAIIESDTVSARVGGFEADLASGRMTFSSSADQRVSIVFQPDQQTAEDP